MEGGESTIPTDGREMGTEERAEETVESERERDRDSRKHRYNCWTDSGLWPWIRKYELKRREERGIQSRKQRHSSRTRIRELKGRKKLKGQRGDDTETYERGTQT